MKKCTKCGIEKDETEFEHNRNECKKCRNKSVRERNRKHPIKRKYSWYKSRAKMKKIEWDLAEDEFRKMISHKCTYCGGDGGSIDRLNNEIGYTKENSIPCCIMCNKMKSNFEFNKWIKKIKKIASRI